MLYNKTVDAVQCSSEQVFHIVAVDILRILAHLEICID